jgi:hypothetical protein
MKKTVLSIAALAAFAGMVEAASVAESASPAFVFLQPEKTALWHTGTGKSFSIPIPYPPGVEKVASLSVTGYRYSANYSDITENSIVLTLPEVSDSRPEKENVYDLALTFADGSVKKARLGSVYGFDGSNVGSTRCLMSEEESAWKFVKRSAVLPIPCGTETVLVNGQEVDTQLDGGAGWFLLAPISGGSTYNLRIDDASAMLNGYADGTVVSIR